jgi:hypothetical protein
MNTLGDGTMRRFAITIGILVGTLSILAVLDAQEQPPAAGADFGKQLMDGLRATEGCYGVEAAAMSVSGMRTIIAWFENKDAVLRWYQSPTHHFFVRAAGADPTQTSPLQHITDPDTPIMVMASIKMGQPAPGSRMPISEFSVALYTPLPGGAMIGGRLAPMDFPIPRMRGMPEDAE